MTSIWIAAGGVMVVAGIVFVGEAIVRLLVKETVKGPMLARRPLRPYVWKQVARRLEEIAKSSDRGEQIFVFDSQLGWTVAPDVAGANGLFHTDVHGIRVSGAAIDQSNRANLRGRVALLGDSYTFGEESTFENTWGHQLERDLGEGYRVLNFGVTGYGLAQMYLRYKKDVCPFHPDVVIVAFTDSVEFRTVSVYGFLCFVSGEPPWPVPRFVIDREELKLINLPLIRYDALDGIRSIEDLPYVRYAWNYVPNEWDTSGAWRRLTRSYLFRSFMAISRPTSQPRPEVSFEEVRNVNVALLNRLLDEIRADGAVPLLLYLPNQADFNRRPSSTRQFLQDNGFVHLDLTSCFGQGDVERMFLPNGGHYSAEGEAAVARYLSPIVRGYLQPA